MPQAGNVALLSQSGALCAAVLDWSVRELVGFSAFVSVGSMLDVGWGELISYFGNDPRTRTIVCYMESVGNARSFLSAAREVALTKPVIVLKVGHTEEAAKAAATHTGAITGSDAVLDAAFRRVGVLRVNNISELFGMAELLGKQPRPTGPRLAIVTNAGGLGALAVDELVATGGQPSPLTEVTINSMNRFLPAFWSHGNPVDILGDADPARFARAVELTASDPHSDGVLAILTPQAMTDAEGTAKAIVSVQRPSQKPVLATWMGGSSVAAGKSVLAAAGIPTFDYPDSAARAFALMARHDKNLRALYETPLAETPETASACALGEELIAKVRKSARTLLTEVESKQLLSMYEIPTVETLSASTEEESVEQAVKMGFPVAVKLFSKTLTHKSDYGGVCLDVRDANDVRTAWQRIRRNIAERAGLQHFLGVTIQPMISRDGFELILGSSVDPQFGPVVLFGAGGQMVEVFKDRALGFPPLNTTLARRLMEQTKIFAALQGFRGRKAIDLIALEQLLVRFSRLIAEQPWIAQSDINPLLVRADQMIALDARFILHSLEASETDLPKLAIRPYPTQYMTDCQLGDGTAVSIRPVRPEDEPLLVKFQRNLSEKSVYMRYFTMVGLDQRIAHQQLSRVCFIDYDREMALVVERRHPSSKEREILGIAMLIKSWSTNEAELAVTVSDAWQGHGLGTKLVNCLVSIGRDEKLGRITARMLRHNTQMRHLARKTGFTVRDELDCDDCFAEIVL